MKIFLLPLALLLIKTINSQNTENLFEKINNQFVKFNQLGAKIAWEYSVNPSNEELPVRAANYQKLKIKWQHNVCARLVALHRNQSLNATQRRQTYLLCRGPMFTFEEAREVSDLYEELQSTYSEAKICIPTLSTPSKKNLTAIEDAILDFLTAVKKLTLNGTITTAVKLVTDDSGELGKEFLCLNEEDDVDKMMKFSRNEMILKWLWLSWREVVGPTMREPFKKLVEIENVAARRNGYSDIGSSWRDELEIPELRQLCRHLYDEVRPLYSMLHGVVRFYLRRVYGAVVPEYGLIPAHLLGNLWSQNWEQLADLILKDNLDLDQSIKSLNWTVEHMVRRAEDYYQSLGLPKMPDKFWKESVFERENDETRCHGTAADMFVDGDVRLLYCSGTSIDDFYVLHHEMGHLQYYMAYSQQPGIFRQANAALHETIGDTIMLGVMTPQHLYRLGLINDTILFQQPDDSRSDDEDDDLDRFVKGSSRVEKITTNDILLLKLALNKLPQIPFSLLIDEYRWKYFEGRIDEENTNEEFWALASELQGIAPSSQRDENYFDVGAKFHVPDNTPYIRYFLTSFLQHHLFESLCKTAVYGRRDVIEDIPDTVVLNRCDIYGSKAVGKQLKDFMSRGHSQNWREILEATTGNDVITAAPLIRYYRPLYHLLKKIIKIYHIPIGW